MKYEYLPFIYVVLLSLLLFFYFLPKFFRPSGATLHSAASPNFTKLKK